MTKSELRKARKAAKVAGLPLTGELAIVPRPSTEKSRRRSKIRKLRRLRSAQR